MAGGHLKRWLGIPRHRPYSTYLDKRFRKHIARKEIRLVLELGSRDLKDAILVQKYYNARVFAFECNPDSLIQCHRNLAKANNVVLIEKAVWNKTGSIKFHPVVSSHDLSGPPHQEPNIGSSSCFLSSNIHYEKYVQSEITVPAVRLDEFCTEYRIDQVDLLCMDLQGAEYEALEGLGDKLSSVKYIISEIETHPLYAGQKCLSDIENLLQRHGFQLKEQLDCIGRNGKKDQFGNYLFVNTRLLN